MDRDTEQTCLSKTWPVTHSGIPLPRAWPVAPMLSVTPWLPTFSVQPVTVPSSTFERALPLPLADRSVHRIRRRGTLIRPAEDTVPCPSRGALARRRRRGKPHAESPWPSRRPGCRRTLRVVTRPVFLSNSMCVIVSMSTTTGCSVFCSIASNATRVLRPPHRRN